MALVYEWNVSMNKYLKKSLLARLISAVLIITIIITPTVGALNGVYDQTFYSGNYITHYNPGDTTGMNCSVNGATGFSAKNNTDYIGNTVFTEAQMQAISANQPFYQEAATAAGIPWQLLAAMHMRESGLKKESPNDDGPYQIVSKSYKIGTMTDDEFKQATLDAANFMKDKSSGKDLSNADNVKYTFFTYNGTAQVYKDQAKTLGFTDEQASNGEGSPYVMNRSDIKRDPTVSPTSTNQTWGQIKRDHGSIEYPANRDYGAFVYYSALAGISSSTCANDSSGLVSGGMTKEQAEAFMSVYSSNPVNKEFIGSSSCSCRGGCLKNCTSFSSYFINKYTSIIGFDGSLAGGNGNQIVPNIIARNPSIQHGTVPRVYAIFSNPAYSKYGPTSAGHTGVVLGIDTENNLAIIGEASCNNASISVRTQSLDTMTNNEDWIYAYSDGLLKDTEMGL